MFADLDNANANDSANMTEEERLAQMLNQMAEDPTVAAKMRQNLEAPPSTRAAPAVTGNIDPFEESQPIDLTTDINEMAEQAALENEAATLLQAVARGKGARGNTI